MAKRALGRGLSALIGENVAPQANRTNVSVPVAPIDAKPGPAMLGDREAVVLQVSEITPNPNQPRKSIDEKALAELAHSIRENGILQPILVRRAGGRYELIAGERRWRASQLAKQATIPALVCTVEESESLRIALLENIQRENLNAIEEAEAYRDIMDRYGATHQEVANMLGKNRSTVSNMVRLLSLETPIREMLAQSHLSMGHARALLAVEGSEARLELAREAATEGHSVRVLERRARQRVTSPRKGKRRSAAPDPDALAIQEFESRLQRHLGSPVRIKRRGQRGRIEIQFFSNEELERLMETVGASSQL